MSRPPPVGPPPLRLLIYALRFLGALRRRAARAVITALGEPDQRMTQLEDRMTTQEQGWAEVKAATDRQGEGLRAIAELLASGDALSGARLSELATRLNQHADAAFAMATEGPGNPVPVPVPDPVGGAPLPGGTTPGTPASTEPEQGPFAPGV